METETKVGEADVDEQVAELLQNPSRNHIFCECWPSLMFCGQFIPPNGSETSEMPDGDECSDCYIVWLGRFCPYCGFHWSEADYQ